MEAVLYLLVYWLMFTVTYIVVWVNGEAWGLHDGSRDDQIFYTILSSLAWPVAWVFIPAVWLSDWWTRKG